MFQKFGLAFTCKTYVIYFQIKIWILHTLKIPTDCIGGLESKESVCSMGDPGSILGLGRSPWDGNANLLLYPCLKNSIDGGAWPVIIHAVAKSWTGLSDFTFFLSFFSTECTKNLKASKGWGTLQIPLLPGVFQKASWGSDSWLWKFTHIQVLRGDMNTKCSEVLCMASWVKKRDTGLFWAWWVAVSTAVGQRPYPWGPALQYVVVVVVPGQTLCQKVYTEVKWSEVTQLCPTLWPHGQ